MTLNLAKVPFQEAIDFFGKKFLLPTRKYSEVMGAMHSQAFMVAGAVQHSLLGDIQSSLKLALANGTTLEDFRKDFDATVEKHGWSYNGGRNWRTALIYNTNLRTAYSAGRYKQQTDPAVKKRRPYLKFVHGASLVPRAEHLAWNGTTLPIDDPWWTTHYPPLGYGCKCRVESVSKADVEEGKETVTEKPKDFGKYDWINPSTGEKQEVPVGIDPGFDYNPGMASGVDDAATRAIEKDAGWTALPSLAPEYYGRPADVPADAPKAELGPRINDKHSPETTAELHKLINSAIGGPKAEFTDPLNVPIVISADAIVGHMMENPSKRVDGREQFFPLLKELIEDPFEVWASPAVNNATGKCGFRRRYTKNFDMGKNMILGLVADVVDGSWVSTTFFRGNKKALGNLRQGNLLWGRKLK